MKKVILLILSIIIISGLFYYYFNKKEEPKEIVFEEIKAMDTKYISGQVWPPVITIFEASELVCNETPMESSASQERVYRENIDGQEYCISALSQGAAGSVYTEYSYSTIKFNKLITLDFTLRFNQCYNYEEDKISECVSERENFSVSNNINEIIFNAKLF